MCLLKAVLTVHDTLTPIKNFCMPYDVTDTYSWDEVVQHKHWKHHISAQILKKIATNGSHTIFPQFVILLSEDIYLLCSLHA